MCHNKKSKTNNIPLWITIRSKNKVTVFKIQTVRSAVCHIWKYRRRMLLKSFLCTYGGPTVSLLISCNISLMNSSVLSMQRFDSRPCPSSWPEEALLVIYAAKSRRQTANASNLILSPTEEGKPSLSPDDDSAWVETTWDISSAVPMRYSLHRRSTLSAENTLDSMDCKFDWNEVPSLRLPSISECFSDRLSIIKPFNQTDNASYLTHHPAPLLYTLT